MQGGDGENCRWVEGVFWRGEGLRHEGATKNRNMVEVKQSVRSKSSKGRSLKSGYGWKAAEMDEVAGVSRRVAIAFL